jgi:hypothetical protein
MERIHKTLMLLGIIGVPALAQTFFFPPPQGPCFTSGTATFEIAPSASAADYKVKIDNENLRPDMRIGLVDSPETADFVLVDDFNGFEGNACKDATSIKTIKVDAAERSPDLTVSLSGEAAGAGYRIYVHSARFSRQDAAALFAVMTKMDRVREAAARR